MKIFPKRFFQRKLHTILPHSIHRTKEGDKWQYMISNKTLKIEKKKKRKNSCHSLPHSFIQQHINNHMLARVQSCPDNWFSDRKKRGLSEIEGRTASIVFFILPLHLNAFHFFFFLINVGVRPTNIYFN